MCGNAKEGRADHKCWASVLCSAVLVTTGETPEGVGDVAHELHQTKYSHVPAGSRCGVESAVPSWPRATA